jgi:hypothetical protein
MTPTETDALIAKHLEGWLGSEAGAPTLRTRVAAMIAEAEAGRDKLWRDGNATLKHQLDAYMGDHHKAIEACMWMHDDKTLDIPLGSRLTSDGVTALRKQRDELRAQLAAMTTARADAIAAAHLAVKEATELKGQLEKFKWTDQ